FTEGVLMLIQIGQFVGIVPLYKSDNNTSQKYMPIQITHHIRLWNLPMAYSQHLLHRRV
uniref:Uncharacterized protein n=1 Tax=Aegilops tauschii subsp. strangulata TaxID=200361 RepID=A0A452XFH0_AEGTS